MSADMWRAARLKCSTKHIMNTVALSSSCQTASVEGCLSVSKALGGEAPFDFSPALRADGSGLRFLDTANWTTNDPTLIGWP